MAELKEEMELMQDRQEYISALQREQEEMRERARAERERQEQIEREIEELHRLNNLTILKPKFRPEMLKRIKEREKEKQENIVLEE